MIAPSSPEAPISDAPRESSRCPASLPTYGRLFSVSCWVCAPVIAFLLLGRNLWLAVSIAIGLALSAAVCGLLYLFVERGMDYFVASARGGAQGKNGSVGQFVILLPAKFLIVGLLGWGLLTLHTINSVAVLVGFGLAQAAITVTAARHFTKR